ncbi:MULTISPECIES: diacylglycerol kinase family protein [Fictibacillus]|uniref:diacylglycerol kinase family protein n=1 Tax=Fictibacillus TaxID=1329200 RepID=UPI001029B1A2|nr:MULTISPECIES: diacylglycerol kinase family protein [Fictibacillus]RZT22313.1 undecaprenol kinase [Fictibacillus sp. BK138]
MIAWKKLLNSFLYAFTGIIKTFKSEQNFKIHIFVSVIVVLTAVTLDFSALRMTVLLIVIGIVLALELMNTAVEKTVDLITMESHPLAKEAKDAAAGAVLVFSIFAVIIGVLLFIEPLLKSIES